MGYGSSLPLSKGAERWKKLVEPLYLVYNDRVYNVNRDDTKYLVPKPLQLERI